jgi:hypothetical protein
MRRILLLGLLAVLSPPALAEGEQGCRCVYDGGEVTQGQTACIRTAQGFMLARCEMVLNNTSWKFLGKPCEALESAVAVTPPGTG